MATADHRAVPRRTPLLALHAEVALRALIALRACPKAVDGIRITCTCPVPMDPLGADAMKPTRGACTTWALTGTVRTPVPGLTRGTVWERPMTTQRGCSACACYVMRAPSMPRALQTVYLHACPIAVWTPPVRQARVT